MAHVTVMLNARMVNAKISCLKNADPGRFLLESDRIASLKNPVKYNLRSPINHVPAAGGALPKQYCCTSMTYNVLTKPHQIRTALYRDGKRPSAGLLAKKYLKMAYWSKNPVA